MMKQIVITDMTLAMGSKNLSFKEKIEIVRHLDKLGVDIIEMPEIENETTDSLLIRTVSDFVNNSVISVAAGMTTDSIKTAAAALSGAKNARLKVALPVSPVQMEYVCHKKPNKMLELAKELFSAAVEAVGDVEFFAADATRAESDFLNKIVTMAVEAGIGTVTLCNDEGMLLPDEFAEFVADVKVQIPAISNVKLGIYCRNTNSMATASALMAMRKGADELKCCIVRKDLPKIGRIASIISNSGERIGVMSKLNYNEMQRITKQIEWICGDSEKADSSADLTADSSVETGESDITAFGPTDTAETIISAVKKLGYDLTDDDYNKVYDEFKRVAQRKTVGSRELEAIVASTALQVPPTYKLVSYVINNGNIITASAQIKLEKNGKELTGVCNGDGPVDASFRTIEQIIGHHFELDDFQIQSVTEGREAVGSAVVRLRHNGKIFSGNGISTDIIGSSIRAYINAVNKIVYEES